MTPYCGRCALICAVLTPVVFRGHATARFYRHACCNAHQGTATDTKNIITLKGSVEIVTEFFGYSINRCVD